MADVIGPNSYLPGQVLPPVENMPCDDHETRPSVQRVVGECDSMGSELIDMCQECFDAFKAAKEAASENPQPRFCNLCRNMAIDCKPWRDPEEGSCGPVYDACAACRKRHRDAFIDDLEDEGYWE